MKMLIVDDDADILKLLEDILILKFPNLNLEVAKNGLEAIEKIKKNNENERPNIVISDMKMPVMNGAELCKLIRENFDGIRVALMTAFQETSDCFDAVFFKPLDFEDLFSFIRKNWTKS
ncbi:MAG: response regulator [Promethearchaeota archaeon]